MLNYREINELDLTLNKTVIQYFKQQKGELQDEYVTIHKNGMKENILSYI